MSRTVVVGSSSDLLSSLRSPPASGTRLAYRHILISTPYHHTLILIDSTRNFNTCKTRVLRSRDIEGTESPSPFVAASTGLSAIVYDIYSSSVPPVDIAVSQSPSNLHYAPSQYESNH